MAKKTRKKVNTDLEYEILYKCAQVCCVCRNSKNVEIHHIDEDPSNNIEDNLVAVCRNCHGDAHTHRKLSQNLTRQKLLNLKKKWEEEVADNASEMMQPTAHSGLSSAMWTYVNHERLPDIMRLSGVDFEKYSLNSLYKSGVVDKKGIPTFKLPPLKGGLKTIYDRFDWSDGRRLHSLYTQAVDDLIEKIKPIELGAIWSKREINAILKPGKIAFCMRGFRFKRGDVENCEEIRKAYARSRNIELQFLVNTRHMFGSSALYGYCGSTFSATLVLIKDVSLVDGVTIIMATPLAMGVGFSPDTYGSPYILKYGWAKHRKPIRSKKIAAKRKIVCL